MSNEWIMEMDGVKLMEDDVIKMQANPSSILRIDGKEDKAVRRLFFKYIGEEEMAPIFEEVEAVKMMLNSVKLIFRRNLQAEPTLQITLRKFWEICISWSQPVDYGFGVHIHVRPEWEEETILDSPFISGWKIFNMKPGIEDDDEIFNEEQVAAASKEVVVKAICRKILEDLMHGYLNGKKGEGK